MDASTDGESESFSIIRFDGYIPAQFTNYIFGKWKRSLRQGNDFFELADQENVSNAYDRYIPLLASKSVLRIAVMSSNHDAGLGFSMIEGETLHYVFVQAECRRNGIARLLVPKPISSFTHLTRMGVQLWNTKLREAKFKPFEEIR